MLEVNAKMLTFSCCPFVTRHLLQLFEHYCKKVKDTGSTIWQNKEEFSLLKEEVRHYLQHNDAKMQNNFMSWWMKQCKLKVRSPTTFNCKVANSEESKVCEHLV